MTLLGYKRNVYFGWFEMFFFCFLFTLQVNLVAMEKFIFSLFETIIIIKSLDLIETQIQPSYFRNRSTDSRLTDQAMSGIGPKINIMFGLGRSSCTTFRVRSTRDSGRKCSLWYIISALISFFPLPKLTDLTRCDNDHYLNIEIK